MSNLYIVKNDDKLIVFNSQSKLEKAGYTSADLTIPKDKFSGKYEILQNGTLYIFPLLEDYKVLAKEVINQYVQKGFNKYSDVEKETFDIQYKGAKDILTLKVGTEESKFVNELYNQLKTSKSLEEFCESIVQKHEEDSKKKVQAVSLRNNLCQSIDDCISHNEVISILKQLKIDIYL